MKAIVFAAYTLTVLGSIFSLSMIFADESPTESKDYQVYEVFCTSESMNQVYTYVSDKRASHAYEEGLCKHVLSLERQAYQQAQQ